PCGTNVLKYTHTHRMTPKLREKFSSLFAVLWAYNHTSYNRPAGFTQPGHPTVAPLWHLLSPQKEPSTSGGVSRKPPYALTLANRLFPGTDEGRASDLLDLFSEIFRKCCLLFAKYLKIVLRRRAAPCWCGWRFRARMDSECGAKRRECGLDTLGGNAVVQGLPLFEGELPCLACAFKLMGLVGQVGSEFGECGQVDIDHGAEFEVVDGLVDVEIPGRPVGARCGAGQHAGVGKADVAAA